MIWEAASKETKEFLTEYTKYYKPAQKEQYKTLSLRWHPDQCVNTEREAVATEAFQYMESVKHDLLLGEVY